MATMAKRGAMVHAEVERMMRSLFKRCVQCPTATPRCPTCPTGDICSLVPQDCNACAHMVCVANPRPQLKGDKSNVGAIAGGVIGGVIFIAILMSFMWMFYHKKKRAQQEALAGEWEEDDISRQKNVHQFNAMRSDAASTRTSRSVANSILSRASNIIHIAFIPGVTNRSRGSGHESMLTAPVPPIPAAYANSMPKRPPKSPLSNLDDALFFRPGSTYSDSSSMRLGKRDTQYTTRSGKRDTQYTTHSITPSLARSSMMSDTSVVYRDDATTEPMPAAQVIRALPRMISVKSAHSHASTSSPSIESPPSADTGTGVKVMMPGQGSVTSSPSSLQSGASFVKATQVTVGSKSKAHLRVRQGSDASIASTAAQNKPAVSSPLVEVAESEDEDEHVRARKSMIRNSLIQAADLTPLIQPVESPFFDATDVQTSAPSATQTQRPNPYAAMSSSVGSGFRHKKVGDNRGPGGLSAVIEEATKRASREPEREGAGVKREQSPFDDSHATQ